MAMEPPTAFDAESVRNEKVKVLRALHTPGPKHIVRGQYGRGFIEGTRGAGLPRGGGRRAGLRRPRRTSPAKLFVDNWRWADTPFYFRTGKRLPKRETTIAIQFKRAPKPPFEAGSEEGLRPNVLLLHIQPDEGVSLAIGAKVPGQGLAIRTVHMDFLYGGAFRTGLPEAYERLILDCMLGDATLFMRADEVEEQWAIVDAIVAAVGARPAEVPQLRRRNVGPGGLGRAAPPRRPLLEAALMAKPDLENTSIRDIERDARAAARRGDRGRPRAEPAHERHDAHGLGAEAVGGGGGADARRARRAAIPRARSCSIPDPDDPRDALDADVDLRCFATRRAARSASR